MNTYVQNPILRVRWAGWESDTLTLSRNGWKVHTARDESRMAMRFMFENPKGAMGFSCIMDDMHYRNFTMENQRDFPVINIGANHLAKEIKIVGNSLNCMDVFAFEEVDTIPVFKTDEEFALDDFKLFRTTSSIITDTEGFAFEEDDIDKVLNTIREMQKPNQRKLLEQAEEGEITLDSKKFHANIVGIIN